MTAAPLLVGGGSTIVAAATAAARRCYGCAAVVVVNNNGASAASAASASARKRPSGLGTASRFLLRRPLPPQRHQEENAVAAYYATTTTIPRLVIAATTATSTTTSSTGSRSFASAASSPEQAPRRQKKKKEKNVDGNDDEEEEEVENRGGYTALKKAAKDRRRRLWDARTERQLKLRTRRSNATDRDGILRREFRNFFIRKKVDDEYHDRKARQSGSSWKLRVAVVLERLAVVLPDKPRWEIEYEQLSAHLSKFGKMYPKELYNVDYELLLNGNDSKNKGKDVKEGGSTLAVTDEELLELLPKGYEPAPRETEADRNGNVRTTNRKLKTSVYLAVLDTDGDDNSTASRWQLPTVDVLEGDGETLLEAARRAVLTKVGSQLEFWCPSNAPVAVDVKKYDDDDDDENNKYYGTKTFFLKVQYDEGSVSEQDMSVQDYAWLDRDEVVDRFATTVGGGRGGGDDKKDEFNYASKFYRYLL